MATYSGDVLPYFIRGIYANSSYDSSAWDSHSGSGGKLINRNFINIADHFGPSFYGQSWSGSPPGPGSSATFYYQNYSGMPRYQESIRYAIQMANLATFGRAAGYANPTNQSYSFSVPDAWLGYGNYGVALFGSAPWSMSMASTSSPAVYSAPAACSLPPSGHFVVMAIATAADATNRYTVGVVIEGYNLAIQSVTKFMESKCNHTNGTPTANPGIATDFCASANFGSQAASGFLFTVYNNCVVGKFGGGFSSATSVEMRIMAIPLPVYGMV